MNDSLAACHWINNFLWAPSFAWKSNGKRKREVEGKPNRLKLYIKGIKNGTNGESFYLQMSKSQKALFRVGFPNSVSSHTFCYIYIPGYIFNPAIFSRNDCAITFIMTNSFQFVKYLCWCEEVVKRMICRFYEAWITSVNRLAWRGLWVGKRWDIHSE